ncbi:DedA family protein [Brevibacterium marinum]|uniref:Membrane protein DedA with SNARE-associated domain n=1 Tax=Brevibacterium marinum TaxID=418643 RepID=A0A846RUL9_9MICO|nr:DedA family protein [Brevibacterium marinum]NJC57854.1 membrane protein DedA with SNARE-associated domain [Brevibacterium marinum]
MDLVLDILRTTIESPWVYLLVFVIAGFDSLIPVVPSETILIAAAAYAAAGIPNPVGLVLVAASGALVGDFAAHLVGRGGGSLVHRWTRSPRVRRMVERSEEIFARRGGAMLISGRFVPGGRTAATLASGILRYPRARFLAFDAAGCLTWALYSTGIGLLGGVIFDDQPLLAAALGVGIALVITGVAEITRNALARRRARAEGIDAAHRGRSNWTAWSVGVAS